MQRLPRRARCVQGLLAGALFGCTVPNPNYEPAPADDALDACASSLAGVGTGDFSIRFNLTAASNAGYRPLLNQRAVCDLSETFWDVVIQADGTLLAHTNGSGILTRLYGAKRIDDSVPHDVTVRRREGVLSTAIDGQVDASTFESADFDVLPPLVIGRGDYCGPIDAVDAVVANVCLTR